MIDEFDFLTITGRDDAFVPLGPGEILFSRGERGTTMFVVRSGRLEVFDGALILETVGPGAILGEMGVVEDEPRSASARALTACEVIVVDRPNFEALVDQTINRWFPPESQATKAPVVDKVRNMIRTTKYDGFAGCAWALSDFDTRPGLSSIKNPIMCICGTKDATYPGMQAMIATIPGAKLTDIEGAGHIANVEQPEKFTKTIRDFIKK